MANSSSLNEIVRAYTSKLMNQTLYDVEDEVDEEEANEEIKEYEFNDQDVCIQQPEKCDIDNDYNNTNNNLITWNSYPSINDSIYEKQLPLPLYCSNDSQKSISSVNSTDSLNLKVELDEFSCETFLHKSTSYSGQYPATKSKNNSDQIIDFSLFTSTTKIIFDQIIGYNSAIEVLHKNNIKYEPTRDYADIWPLCLNARTIRFFHLSDLESQKLQDSNEICIPQTQLSPKGLLVDTSQFWFAFERRPNFNENLFNIDVELLKHHSIPITNNTKLGTMKLAPTIYAKLSYGALTSMNQYYYHPEYQYRNDSSWAIQIRLRKLEIIRMKNVNSSNMKNTLTIERKTVLPAELINHTAIFKIDRFGFDVYICIKGNPHEFEPVVSSDEKCRQFNRMKSNNNDCPKFSTICFSVSVNTDRKRSQLSRRAKAYAIEQIKYLFKYLLDYFYTNQITVCFGNIKMSLGCLTNISTRLKLFTTPIQIYAFIMLRNVDYSIEHKISEKKTISELLLHLSNNDDDKFYRLCLYLVRRSSEYHFLDLENELYYAEEEYQNQIEQCNYLNEKMATILVPPRENYAYVPSISVTPTIIYVRPLKLVKLHRILREKNFNDPMSFALVEIRDEANRPLYARDFQSLRSKFNEILTKGINIHRTCYKYLHHSMSQVKEKQFWFLNSQYSLEDMYSWMGNFDNERVIAKHAARIAQCFTSTEPSIRIPAEHVKYVADIETIDKQYCFTDGVGTLSEKYFKQVQIALGKRFMPSVLQIRYGGCKGTLSVDPRLDDQPHQLVFRESMRKFTSDHDQLEICKISSPRSLYLNRQDILLLSTRGIPDSHFLILQNENHLWLVNALLCSSIAFELLNDRVGSMHFDFRSLANTINLVEEPFFLQLIINTGHDCVSKFQQRAKIKTVKNKARNMFGIVDEYGVLEYGQVFIKYSHITDEKLNLTDKPSIPPPTTLNNVKVVITKNPCHHPGDLRTFMAVDKVELKHLVDVVVFPQKGPRPHPNEISGSDLDGDEYAVIWDPDLVPSTENDDPYDYDSQDKPIKLDRPVERNDINEIVLDIASQNLTGDMSNLHLALADVLGTRHPEVTQLAGLISQELDAPKTGKHPITSEELNRYRAELLKHRYPDFMMKERHRSYPSTKIIGQLYRAARRAIIRWHKASRTHCSLRYLQIAQTEDQLLNDANHVNKTSETYSNYVHSSKQFSVRIPSLTLDSTITHPLAKSQELWAKKLFAVYRENLRNIISVFNYQDEVDLFCRCQAVDQVATGKQDLNISAGLELQRLIDTTRQLFYSTFDQLAVDKTLKPPHDGFCARDRSCAGCKQIKLARAAACYNVCYSQAAYQAATARSRILSFPWLFSSLITELKRTTKTMNHTTYQSEYIVIGRAMRNEAKRLIEKQELRLKIYCPVHSDRIYLFLRSLKPTNQNIKYIFKRDIIEMDKKTNDLCTSKILFIEILNSWITRQNIFGQCLNFIDMKPTIREICWHQILICFISTKDHELHDDNITHESPHFEQYKVVFQSFNNLLMGQRYVEHIQREISLLSIDFDYSMYCYFISIIRLCFRYAHKYKSAEYAYLSEYLILALQSIGIDKELNDIAFDTDS